MNRQNLQNRITDAADGVLTEAEQLELEKELASWPDLLEEYRMIMALPDPALASGDELHYRDEEHLRQILQAMDGFDTDSFQQLTINLFRRYALAASLLFLAVSAGFNFTARQPASEPAEIGQLIYSETDVPLSDYLILIEQAMEN